MIVVDTSAILELLLNTRHATQVAEQLFLSGETLPIASAGALPGLPNGFTNEGAA